MSGLALLSSRQLPERAAQAFVPYVGFRGKKSEKGVESLDAAGIVVDKATGNGVFYLQDVDPIKVSPFRLHLLQYTRLYTTYDDNMNIVSVKDTITEDDFRLGYRNHIFGVCLVIVEPGHYVAATIQLRGPNSQALKDAINRLDGPAADTERWSRLSPAHAESARVPFPGGRFVTEIWSTLETPRGGGPKFNLGHGRCYPTPADMIDPLIRFVESNEASIKAAFDKYDSTINHLRSLA